MNDSQKVFVITGPTASGKTAFAVRMAKEIGAEIISADSRQVFRFMDIGTGKDLKEYGTVPYHLIDIRYPNEEFSVSDFRQYALQAIRNIHQKGKFPIICGGTGHYIKALIENYAFDHASTNRQFTSQLETMSRDELYTLLKKHALWDKHQWTRDSKRRMARAIEKMQTPKKSEPNISRRYNYPTRIYHTFLDREQLTQRIRQRLQKRLRQGMIEEISNLLKKKIDKKRLERFGLEYKWILYYLKGELSYGEMEEKLYVEICRFSKRQSTFLRYLAKSGHQLIPIRSYKELRSDAMHWISEAAS